MYTSKKEDQLCNATLVAELIEFLHKKNKEHNFKRDFKINHKMKINKLIFWIESSKEKSRYPKW